MTSLEITSAPIGQQSWRNETLNTIRLAHGLIQKSDLGLSIGRTQDPLPHQRDILCELSNQEATKYCREVRVISLKLVKSILATNEEVKSLLSVRYILEKQLEHVRKDMKVNYESVCLRNARPEKEKITDGADDLLHAERLHLKNLKQDLEGQLMLVYRQMRVLDKARTRVQKVYQERRRVLDLLCSSATVNPQRLTSTRDGLTSRQRVPHALTSVPTNTNGCPRAQSARDDSRQGRSDTQWAASTGDQGEGFPNPLGAFTPECAMALGEAEEARKSSHILRNQLKGTVDRIQKMQNAAHQSVNDGITRKIAETASLKQHLQLAQVDNRSAANRAARWYHTTERALGQTTGPESSMYLGTREKLDRPMIRVFQRHPGTQLPEAMDIIRSTDGLQDSLVATSKNLHYMRMADCRLRGDIWAKQRAMDVDLTALRNRRSKANHRWPMKN